MWPTSSAAWPPPHRLVEFIERRQPNFEVHTSSEHWMPRRVSPAAIASFPEAFRAHSSSLGSLRLRSTQSSATVSLLSTSSCASLPPCSSSSIRSASMAALSPWPSSRASVPQTRDWGSPSVASVSPGAIRPAAAVASPCDTRSSYAASVSSCDLRPLTVASVSPGAIRPTPMGPHTPFLMPGTRDAVVSRSCSLKELYAQQQSRLDAAAQPVLCAASAGTARPHEPGYHNIQKQVRAT